MASKRFKNLLFVLCVIVLCESVYPTEYVPVVLWNASNNHKYIPALQHVGKEQFNDIMQVYIKDKPFVVIFEDENLSAEDFTSRDTSGVNVFDGLNKVIHSDANYKLSYLPAVQSPSHVLLTLNKKLTDQVKAKEVRSGSGKISKPAAGRFLFIQLDEAEENEDRPHLLKRHVEFISETYTRLRDEYPDLLAIYTARQPSWYTPSSSSSRKSRHLLESADGEGTAMRFVDAHIMIYLSNAPIIRKDNQAVALTSIKFSETENGTVQLNGVAMNGSFLMTFTTGQGYWALTSVDVGDENVIKVKDVFAPIGFSYHCSNLSLSNKNISIEFPKVQFQPNFDGNFTMRKFGDAYDCIGFTSVPIWSGLFVTFILAMIMTVGLCMMMDIKTMDRFDDPKGKTITVTASE